MTVREQLNSIAEKRTIILDGAMGSIINILNLDERSYRGDILVNHLIPLEGCKDLLCLTRPGAIGAIHDTYLEAGADIITTCSFRSSAISLAEYGIEHLSYDICSAAAKIARKSAEKYSVHGRKCFVAGSLGPTKKTVSQIGWDNFVSAYYDNARGLLDGGADILLIETVCDIINAKAALHAIKRLFKERDIDVPIMISAGIFNEEGWLRSGENLQEFCNIMMPENPWSIGINCSFNAARLLPHTRTLSEIAPCLVSVYPNAGLQNIFGRYDEMPNVMAANIMPFLKEKLVNIIGGCCGSTPAHIAAIADKANDFNPRKIPKTGTSGEVSHG
ncbi:MAG: homocysteine S-methyltransferase family protein [Treponema sp.]|nr:homocysteine S-methyltransferase family protein [Treponema sp.]